MLSFPLEGTSIAVDMAVSPDIQQIVDRLNEFVIAAGGRIYLTKDRFTRPEHYRAMEPRLPRVRGDARNGPPPPNVGCEARSRFASLGDRVMKAVILGGTSGMGRAIAVSSSRSVATRSFFSDSATPTSHVAPPI